MLKNSFIILTLFMFSFLIKVESSEDHVSKEFEELRLMVNKCVEMVELLGNKLNSIQKTLDTIETDKNKLTTLIMRIDHLEQHHEGANAKTESTEDTNINERLTLLEESVASINVSEEIITNLELRLETLEQNGMKTDAENDELNAIRKTLAAIKSKENEALAAFEELKKLETTYGESFETLNVLKEVIAELRKDLEDQQVVTGLLQKEIKKSKKGKKKEEKSLKAKVDLISEIVVEHDKLLTNTMKIEENDREEQTLSDLGKYLYGSGEGLSSSTGDISAVQDETETKKSLTIYDIQGYHEIGSGFYANDFRFSSFGSSVEFSGSILNGSKKNYNVTDFIIMLYDKENVFIRDQEFSITGLMSGESKAFHEIISGVHLKDIAKYACVFGRDQEPLKYVVVNSEKVLDIKKPKNEKAKLNENDLEDFEDIGGNFFIKDIILKTSAYVCKVSGIIRDNSGGYYGLATFVIRFYDENDSLIKDHEFVVSFNEKSTVKFNEVISGINAEDIDFYEISIR